MLYLYRQDNDCFKSQHDKLVDITFALDLKTLEHYVKIQELILYSIKTSKYKVYCIAHVEDYGEEYENIHSVEVQ